MDINKYNITTVLLMNSPRLTTTTADHYISVTSLLFKEIKDVLIGGDSTREEIEDPSCFNYLTTGLAVTDTILAAIVIVCLLVYAVKSYAVSPSKLSAIDYSSERQQQPAAMKTLLLITLCIVFGTEIGFKFASKEAIFFLFFCHFITVIEIYLLAVPPSPLSTAVLRCLMHILHLAFFGILFMDVKGRQFFGEVAQSWIQHLMIFIVVPPYLVYQRGINVLEPLGDFTWASISGALFLVLCYFVHQPVSFMTKVNINFTLCPISPYPFEGPYYRLIAIFHQIFCIMTLGKIYTAILHLVLPSKTTSTAKQSSELKKTQNSLLNQTVTMTTTATSL